MSSLLAALGLSLPIFQAPMAGVSTPALAAAVANAGGLGALGLGASTPAQARAALAEAATLTPHALNANFFVHRPPLRDEAAESAWLAALTPEFARFGAQPPARLSNIYPSFATDDAQLAVALEARPRVVSFHFGLPDEARIRALKAAGCLLLATATNLDEAQQAARAGIDALIAQGYEAGGHRGLFDEHASDARLPTATLTRLLVTRTSLPVIAAGGIMDGAGIKAALALGAVAAQLGTAFIACPESAADAAYRAALRAQPATVMTRAISGRPARCLANGFTAWGQATPVPPAAYPLAYDAGKALNAAAKAKGETGYGAQWAGQGAAMARALPAGALMAELARELASAA
jgi:nitronate monooxygenase